MAKVETLYGWTPGSKRDFEVEKAFYNGNYKRLSKLLKKKIHNQIEAEEAFDEYRAGEWAVRERGR